MLALLFLPTFFFTPPTTLYVVDPLSLLCEQVTKKYPEGTVVPKDEFSKISRDVSDAINKVEDQTGYEFTDQYFVSSRVTIMVLGIAGINIVLCDDLVRKELEKKLNCVPKNTKLVIRGFKHSICNFIAKMLSWILKNTIYHDDLVRKELEKKFEWCELKNTKLAITTAS